MLTVYTTSTCGYCVRLKDGLSREAIGYREVNLEHTSDAVEIVKQLNGGTVPTVVFDDGTAMTNPTLREIKAKLGP
jgi:mycoredoxin